MITNKKVDLLKQAILVQGIWERIAVGFACFKNLLDPSEKAILEQRGSVKKACFNAYMEILKLRELEEKKNEKKQTKKAGKKKKI